MSEKNKVQLIATRQTLMDEQVFIKVSGLQPSSKLTIIATSSVMVAIGEALFYSFAHYFANDNGDVDLRNALSVGGSYDGIEPMGLFWSMVPAPDQKSGILFNISDVTKPVIVKLILCEGHVNNVNQRVQEFQNDKCEILQSCQIERWYLKWDGSILRIPVRSGAIRGTLFVPKDGKSYPGVIDLFGGTGGLLEYRAALMASHGFASLALAYFDYDDLPKTIELNLEYFNEAADWLAAQPMVIKNFLAVVGVSFGANFACILPVLNSKINAVVSINGTHYLHGGIIHYKGHILPNFINLNTDLVRSPGGFVVSSFAPVAGYAEIDSCLLQIQQAAPSTSFLFIHGGDDLSADAGHSFMLARRLNASGLRRCRLIIYPGAGHLLEPPHTPINRYIYVKRFAGIIDYGGDMRMHADAQESSWKEILTFLLGTLASNNSHL